jgi:hypothetical protein
MRFPRALDIRDDLDISDCMTASGAHIALSLLSMTCLNSD